MPELPEVETVRRQLAPELEGRRIRRVRIHQPDIVLPPRPAGGIDTHLVGARVEEVARRGKYLLLHVERPHADRAVLQVQLRMTGRFALGRGLEVPETLTHVAAELHLDDGRVLWYDDVRRLGGLRLLTTSEWEEVERRLGPEPLEPEFSTSRLGRILAGSRAPIKNLLLNQSRVAGIGNIYASEALHEARIDPRRPARELRPPEVRRLHGAVRRILRRATAAAGTTVRDYRGLDGRAGGFQVRLRVYGRAGEPCPRCGEEVRRIVQAGRSTFFCSGCQA